MAKYDDNDGVWRTIGGRRVFIKKGQSMSDAMKESGKFKISNKKIESKSNSSTDSKIKQLYHDTWNAKKDYKELKDELDKLKNSGDATQEDIDRVKKEAQKEFNSSKKEENEKKNEYTKEEIIEKLNKEASSTSEKEYQLFKKATENPDSIDAMTENSTDWENLDTKYRTRYDNERLEIAKDIAKELYAMNDEHPRLEKQAKEILEPADGYVLDDNETFYTNKDGNIELSTKTLTEWRDRLKKDKVNNTPEYNAMMKYVNNNKDTDFKDYTQLDNNTIIARAKNNTYSVIEGSKFVVDGEKIPSNNKYMQTNSSLQKDLLDLDEKDFKKINNQIETISKEEYDKLPKDYKLSTYEKEMINATNNKDEQMRNKAIGQRYSGTIDYLKQTTNLSIDDIMKIIKKMIEESNK